MTFANEFSDFFIERHFHKVDGGYLYFRSGLIGKSYRITDEKKAELSAYLRKGNVWAGIILLSAGIIWWLTGNDALAFGFIVIFLFPLAIYEQIRMKHMLKDAQRSPERLTVAELQRANARLMTGRLALAWWAFTLLLAGLDAYLAYTSYGSNRALFWLAAVIAVLLGVMVVWLADVMRHKLSEAA
jgi:hypothetical protein